MEYITHIKDYIMNTHSVTKTNDKSIIGEFILHCSLICQTMEKIYYFDSVFCSNNRSCLEGRKTKHLFVVITNSAIGADRLFDQWDSTLNSMRISKFAAVSIIALSKREFESGSRQLGTDSWYKKGELVFDKEDTQQIYAR